MWIRRAGLQAAVLLLTARRSKMNAYNSALGTVCLPGVREVRIVIDPSCLKYAMAAVTILCAPVVPPPDPSVANSLVLLSSAIKFGLAVASHADSSIHVASCVTRSAGSIARSHLHGY